jgi:hypothetical protein
VQFWRQFISSHHSRQKADPTLPHYASRSLQAKALWRSGDECPGVQTAAKVVPFAPDKREPNQTTAVDESGRSIVALLERAAGMAKDDCKRAMDLAHRLTFQLREAEERVRALEDDAAHFRDRAVRAEEWLHHIHREVEQTFFQKK